MPDPGSFRSEINLRTSPLLATVAWGILHRSSIISAILGTCPSTSSPMTKGCIATSPAPTTELTENHYVENGQSRSTYLPAPSFGSATRRRLRIRLRSTHACEPAGGFALDKCL